MMNHVVVIEIQHFTRSVPKVLSYRSQPTSYCGIIWRCHIPLCSKGKGISDLKAEVTKHADESTLVVRLEANGQNIGLCHRLV